MACIRVVLPSDLLTLAKTYGELRLQVAGPITQARVLDALEARCPWPPRTMRDQTTHQRRPLLRFYACEQDPTFETPDAPLPAAVIAGSEPFCIIGAIAGG